MNRETHSGEGVARRERIKACGLCYSARLVSGPFPGDWECLTCGSVLMPSDVRLLDSEEERVRKATAALRAAVGQNDGCVSS